MIRESSRSLLSVLDRRIRNAGLSRRAIERTLGLGQGYLNSLFKGRIQLRVAHVNDIARVVGVDPLALYFEAFPPKDTKWLLEQLGIRPDGKAPGALLGALASNQELHQLIRDVVRDEMSRLSTEEEP